MQNQTSTPQKFQPSTQLFFSGDEYFQSILQDLKTGHQEVLIESYIFNYDPIGIQILNELGELVKKGVKVQILVDGIGTFNWLTQIRNECDRLGIKLRVYHPIPFQLKVLKYFSWKRIIRVLRIFQRINKRNHRKIVMIDRKTVYIGSLNVSQDHSARYLGSQAWRDTAVRLHYPDANEDCEILAASFNQIWRGARLPGAFAKTRKLLSLKIRSFRSLGRIRINTRLYWRLLMRADMMKRIKEAKHRILITNAYFLPRRRVIKELLNAQNRGVRVSLLLPQKTDVWIVREASRSLFANLLKNGVKIFEYIPTVLHAKTMIIDSWGIVGTTNLNHRSFLHDLEVEVAIHEPELISELVEHFHEDVEKSHEMHLSDLGKISWIRLLIGRFIYWFRYWL